MDSVVYSSRKYKVAARARGGVKVCLRPGETAHGFSPSGRPSLCAWEVSVAAHTVGVWDRGSPALLF